MAEITKQQSIIPDLPRGSNLIDKDGRLTAEWALFLDKLISALQGTLNQEGLAVPPQTAANIALLTGTASLGNILYDSTNNSFRGNLGPGVWKTFTLT